MNNTQELDPFDGLDELPTTSDTKVKKTKQPKQPTIKLPKQPPAVKAPPTKADTQAKAKLIYGIQAYGKNKRLGKYLEQECGHRFDDKYLKNLSLTELKLELEKQEVALGGKQNNGLIDQGIHNGLLFAENIVVRTSRLNVQGTTEALYKDEHYLDLLERVKMKYTLPFVKLDPVMELALVIGQTAMLCHHTNTYRDTLHTSTNLDEEVQV